MKVKSGLVLSSLALATLMLFTSVAQADVYSGYDKTSRVVLTITQKWELWVRISPPLQADINKDGIVNILDVCIVTSCWQMHEGDAGWDPRADLNKDGTVDILDVCMVTTYWNQSCQYWKIEWKQTGSWPYTSAMYCWSESYIKAWDDKGFSWSWGPDVYPAHGFSGELTLTYQNTYTWTHTEICWCYMVTTAPFWFDYVKCRVDIYVGA